MVYVVFFDTAGTITQVDKSSAATFGESPFVGNDWCIEVPKGKARCAKNKYYVKNKRLVRRTKRTRAPLHVTPIHEIRENRDLLLRAAGNMLTELMLEDSFPKLSRKEKQAKIDALVQYRVLLRAITDCDTNEVEWPEMPT